MFIHNLHKIIAYLYFVAQLVYLIYNFNNYIFFNILSLLMILSPISSFFDIYISNKRWKKIYVNSLINCIWCFWFIHFNINYIFILYWLITTVFFVYRSSSYELDKRIAITNNDKTFLIIPSWKFFGYNTVCTILAEIFKIIVIVLKLYNFNWIYVKNFALLMGYISNVSIFLTFLYKKKIISTTHFNIITPIITFSFPFLLYIKIY